MRHLLAAFALILVAAQDPTQDDLSRWARELGSDEADRREEAHKNLLRSGEAARATVKGLLTSEDPEIRGRAEQILKQIDDLAEIGTTLSVPTVSCDVKDEPFKKLLETWAERTKVAIECEAGDAPVTLKVENVSLLEALDRLCAARGDIVWNTNGTMKVKVTHGKYVARPCVYAGPVRVTLTKVRETRSNDFEGDAGADASVWLRVDSLMEDSPWKETIELSKATLPDGTSLSVGRPTANDAAAMMGGAVMVEIAGAMLGGAAPKKPDGEEFVARGIPRSAEAITGLEGALELAIPVGWETVTVSEDDIGKTFEFGDMKVKVESWKSKQARLRITPKDQKDASHHAAGAGAVFVYSNLNGDSSLKDELERRVDLESVKSADGAKLEADFKGGRQNEDLVLGGGGAVFVGGPGANNSDLVVKLPKDGDVDKLSFRLKTRTHKQSLPFKIDRVPLP